MKKMININFQGRIIPIEETSFDILKNYIDSLRAYFAKEEGRDEIINDIESRIAELFSERLKNTACITDNDVNQVIAGMGRPEDFEEAEATGNYNSAARSPEAEKQSTAPEIKKWRRSRNDSILGGVCGGIANYLKIDPAIVRVLFAILAVGSFGFCLLVYILLWIILPSQEMEPNAPKRFYRSPDHKVIGGVGGGLAAYFSTDVWVPRLIFAFPIISNILVGIIDADGLMEFFGGLTATSFIIYIILWIILPVARSTSARLEMKGEKVNLQSIKNSVKEEPVVIVPVRPSRIGKAIGMAFKAFFFFIAAIISFVLIMILVTFLFGTATNGFNISALSSYIFETPLYGFLAWGSFILLLGVPALALLTWMIRRLMGVRSRRSYLAYIFTTLWVIGFIGFITFIILTARHYQYSDDVEEDIALVAPSHGKLLVRATEDNYQNRYKWRRIKGLHLMGDNEDSLLLSNVQVDIIPSKDSSFYMHQIKSSNGYSRLKARALANAIHFNSIQNDSILTIPKGFTIKRYEKFRNQQVLIVIEVPIGKKIELDKSVNSYNKFFFFNKGDWDSGWKSNYRWDSNVEYIMTTKGLKTTERPVQEKGQKNKEREDRREI